MSEELTLKCKCGAVECKFDALPRMCFNCQCHSCVAAMKAIEGKEGFDGTSAAVDGGVGVAIYKSNNVSVVKASSNDIDFVKVGDQGKAARPYCNKCGTMVFNVFLPNWVAVNRNAMTKSDGSAFVPEGTVKNINCKHAFDPAAAPEPKHNTVPVGTIMKFIPLMMGLGCDGSNKSEKALMPEDMAKVEAVPITWE